MVKQGLYLGCDARCSEFDAMSTSSLNPGGQAVTLSWVWIHTDTSLSAASYSEYAGYMLDVVSIQQLCR